MLYKVIYKVYFIKFKNKNIDRLYHRLTIRVLNILLPVIFKIFPGNNNSIKKEQGNKKPEYIVSLTTFPARINKVWLAIESILRQKEKPDKIILWLYEGEFPDKNNLPKNLLSQEKRGLEIRFCDENLMPHKKYFYTMQEYAYASVVTIDDDMIYPPDLISKFIMYNKKYPGTIICSIGRRINLEDGNILPYKKWEYLNCITGPSFQVLPIGCGGIFYPPDSLHSDVFDINNLKKLAITADDLWLKVMELKNNTGVLNISGEYPRFFIPIIQKNNINQSNINIGEGENDRIFKTLMNYYKIPATIFNQ